MLRTTLKSFRYPSYVENRYLFVISLSSAFFLRFILMWTIFKVFVEFVTILLLFYVLVFWLRGMWDLSPPTRDRTLTPCIGKQSLNHWTTREVPVLPFE